ncbi:(deoxy)nucleoside triphosphate pyrophosphohydrolase [Microbacterium terrae]|nr:(deoxy)nucleoside triphosphate pyrophosphohydrolase [Microbacterium terrae]
MRKQIDVVGAVMLRNGNVLCAQRGPRGALAGFWEFPGGKIEPGESPRAALEREIGEELECVVAVGDELTTSTHAYEFGDVTLTTFWCEIISGTPTLTEHSSVRWLPPSQLGELPWAPADLPAVELIATFGVPHELGAD